ncbi:MAG: 50S ribosomal protein L29 [Clostridiales bacterium]|jgi:large subunit ribosomal protein L29|nr:50S ribosomal protein L29 [Clostridiales bacterium]
MKAKQVRELSPEDLNKKLGDLKRQLFDLRFQNATKQIDNPLKIVEVRRDIARVKTILREKNGR